MDGYLRSRMDDVILNIFEINYSRLIQYEILEKLVTLISPFADRMATKKDFPFNYLTIFMI